MKNFLRALGVVVILLCVASAFAQIQPGGQYLPSQAGQLGVLVTNGTTASWTQTPTNINSITAAASTDLTLNAGGGANNNVNLQAVGTGAVIPLSPLKLTPGTRSSGVASYFSVQQPADTGITASTEGAGFVSTTATRTWATTGTVALQRENFWAGPTYASASASQTFTDVFTGFMTPPIQGSNALFTRGHTFGILDSTAANSSITGAFIVASTIGTAGGSVAIGGGNIEAGNTIKADGAMYSAGLNLAGGNSLVIGNESGGTGLSNSNAWLIKTVTGIANASATSVLTVSIPNSAQSASLHLVIMGSLGAGGAIGANEASGVIEYDVVIARTTGVNAVLAISGTPVLSTTAAVAGASTITVAASLGSVTGAVGATNTCVVNVTISHGTGSSTNHTCVLKCETLNANSSGVSAS